MKIWFDILTPKQIMFFTPLINILKSQNHDIFCTSRNYREANDLAKLHGIDLLIVGSHGGADLYNKLIQSTKRIIDLSKIINDFSPDLSISFSSPEASRVSFGLGIDHFAFNDSPHAEAVAKLTIPLLTKLFTPSIIPILSWKKYGISSKNIIQYNGLDPVAWLIHDQKYSTSTNNINEINNFKFNKYNPIANKKTFFLEKFGIDPMKKSILIRLEESQAAYISKQKLRLDPISLVDYMVDTFGYRNNVIILCRYKEQIEQIAKRYRNKAIVLTEVVNGLELLKNIDIFIGAGGTMTAESALLGKPTISIAPVRFFIDDYLNKIGLVSRAFDISSLDKIVSLFLNDTKKCYILEEKAKLILSNMENPIDKIVEYLKTYTPKTKK